MAEHRHGFGPWVDHPDGQTQTRVCVGGDGCTYYEVRPRRSADGDDVAYECKTPGCGEVVTGRVWDNHVQNRLCRACNHELVMEARRALRGEGG